MYDYDDVPDCVGTMFGFVFLLMLMAILYVFVATVPDYGVKYGPRMQQHNQLPVCAPCRCAGTVCRGGVCNATTKR